MLVIKQILINFKEFEVQSISYSVYFLTKQNQTRNKDI